MQLPAWYIKIMDNLFLLAEDTRPSRPESIRRRAEVVTLAMARVDLPQSPAPCNGQRKAELMDVYMSLMEELIRLVTCDENTAKRLRLSRLLGILRYRLNR